jgi:hypothetical protein
VTACNAKTFFGPCPFPAEREATAMCVHEHIRKGLEGAWGHEPLPSDRDDEWLNTHRFDFDTALELAKQHAPQIKVNGWTVAQVLAEWEAEAKK